MPARSKLDWAVVFSCLLFIFALVVSAYFEPKIRILHALQALIYIVVIAGSLGHRKWAYGAGIFIAAFWNYANLFVTTFIRNGFAALGALVTGAHVGDPGTIIAVPAAIGHFGMILFCLWAYFRLRDRRWSDIGVLLGSGAVAIGYFVVIITLFGPQYLPIFRQMLHI